MYQLNFTLKQHTPLIHFQHEQDGATLRASEVKPKLDRYLITKYKLTQVIYENGEPKEIPKQEYQNCFVGKGIHSLALNYKMNICSSEINKRYIILSTKENKSIQDAIKKDITNVELLIEAPYFANNNLLKKKDGVDSKGNRIKLYDSVKSQLEIARQGINLNQIECSIISIYTELITWITDSVEEFFIFHNFGTRQSKGFGCFTINSLNGVNVKCRFENIVKLAKNEYSVFKTDMEHNNINELFANISKSYQILKSGTNITSQRYTEYIKSLLFLYFCKEKNIRWEKRWIKQKAKQASQLSNFKNGNKVIDCDCSYELESPSGLNYNYVRSVLGLSEQFEFLKNFGSDKFQVSVKNPDIERYQSPILIKVHEGKVYFICHNTFHLIKSKDFDLKLNDKTTGGVVNLISNFGNLITPASFDIEQFMNWAGVYMQKVIDGEEPDVNCEDDLIKYAFKITQIKSSKND